jgi:glycosyltransferase involved in cell wall biosynthesis
MASEDATTANVARGSCFVDDARVAAYTSSLKTEGPQAQCSAPVSADFAPRRGRPLRILMTSQYFWPEPFPINDLAWGLVERGHAVTVLTGLPNHQRGSFFPGYGLRGPWRESHGGIDVRRVPLVPRGGGGKFRIALNHLSYALTGSSIGLLRGRGNFDLVIASQPSPLISVIPGLLLSKLKRVPFVLWIQDLWPESLAVAGVRSRLIWYAMERMMRFVYRHTDLVLVQSRAFDDHALSRGVARERIRYLPNWAGSHYRPMTGSDAPSEDAELPRGFRVIFGGNLGEAQALETVIDAATRLRDRSDIKFIFIGDGRRRAWLEAEIKKRNLEQTVSCLGHRSSERMPYYYASADALLMTLKRNETMAKTIPSKLQPYLASGRPVIAALDGEAKRIVITSGAGVGCPAEDANALANMIAALAVSAPQDRAAMGQAALGCYQQEFERTKLLNDLEGWLADLMASGTAVRGTQVRSGNA